ncbi:GluClalpha, partial [Apostichopus japonicus]
AIDVWFDMCLGFVTMSLLEYALVHYLWNRDMEIKHLQMASQKKPVYKKPIAIWNRGKAKAEVDVESAEEIEMDSEMHGRYNYSTTYRPLDTKEDDNEVGFVAYNGNTPGSGNGHDRKKEPKQLVRESNRGSTTKLIALNIDRVSRILFPFCFILALLIYYIVYNYIAPDHFV